MERIKWATTNVSNFSHIMWTVNLQASLTIRHISLIWEKKLFLSFRRLLKSAHIYYTRTDFRYNATLISSFLILFQQKLKKIPFSYSWWELYTNYLHLKPNLRNGETYKTTYFSFVFILVCYFFILTSVEEMSEFIFVHVCRMSGFFCWQWPRA